MPFLNVDPTSLLNRAKLLFLPGDEELVQPTPPSHPRASSSSKPSSCLNSPDLLVTLTSIQKEQASLRAYVENEHASLWGFVQERHDEVRGMIASQNQYFQYCRPA